jgi:hypothetical protein
MDTLTQLVALYNQEGWKHLENWISQQIQNCMVDIMNPDTPTDEIEKLRMVAYTYQSILDKVIADKETLKQMDAQKE